jgi:hypothetical protein
MLPARTPKEDAMRHRALLLALAWPALTGCATDPTPYQAKATGSPWGGYTEVAAGAPGYYLVQFEGNGFSTREEVLRHWHQRAAELCPSGYTVENERRGQGFHIDGGNLGFGFLLWGRIYPRMSGYARCAPTPATAVN